MGIAVSARCSSCFRVGTHGTNMRFIGSRALPGDGSNSVSPVVLDSAGNVYGVTQNGGTSGNGVVFEYIR